MGAAGGTVTVTAQDAPAQGQVFNITFGGTLGHIALTAMTATSSLMPRNTVQVLKIGGGISGTFILNFHGTTTTPLPFDPVHLSAHLHSSLHLIRAIRPRGTTL